VRDTVVRGHYYRGEDEGMNRNSCVHVSFDPKIRLIIKFIADELVVLSDALTEQEAFGIEALEECVRDISGNDKRFYEAREFGEDESAPTFGMYNKEGGNYCTFLNGLLQIYLPGVAASTSRVLQKAFNDSNWAETRDKPSPDTLGIHSAEFLKYRTTGKLGLHSDDESVYTISIALSKFGDYEGKACFEHREVWKSGESSNHDLQHTHTGGYFQLFTGEALFKVPRRSAIVFFGESLHGVTEIQRGERSVFVAEYWDEEDAPIGSRRPSLGDFSDQNPTAQSYRRSSIEMQK